MKRYFWLLYLLLVTVAAALAAEMVNAYISAQLAAPLKPTQTQASRISGPLAAGTFDAESSTSGTFLMLRLPRIPQSLLALLSHPSAPRSPGNSLAAEARGHHGGDKSTGAALCDHRVHGESTWTGHLSGG